MLVSEIKFIQEEVFINIQEKKNQSVVMMSHADENKGDNHC